MRLHEFQEQFRDLMLDAPDALEAPDADFAAQFEAGDIALPERLKVYRSTIVGGIAETLCKGFPILEKLVGADFLRETARRFVMAHPPEAGCLNLYGRGFDDFIRANSFARDFPYLPDMAALEIAMNEAYYAPDDEGLGAEALAGLSPDDLGALRLGLRHSARIVRSDYNLAALRAYCLAPEGPIPDINTPCALLIMRPDLEVHILPLSEAEVFMLGLLQGGAALGDAAERTVSAHNAFDPGAFLQKHLALGSFQALKNDA